MPETLVARAEVTFTKVTLPYGWLSNMSPHPIVYEGQEWRTAEALFQALRFADADVREAIRAARSPMTAKMVAKRHKQLRVVEPMGAKDLGNMRLCLRLKLSQHAELQAKLRATGDAAIYEDCTSRGRRGSNLFWGAMRVPGGWEGQNWLGRLWEGLSAQPE